MSLEAYVGPEGNLLEMKAQQCHRILLLSPFMSIEEINAMKTWRPPMLAFDHSHHVPEGGSHPGYQLALQRVCSEAAQANEDGITVIILSDRATGPTRVPLSALVACGGVRQHLSVLHKKRAKVALMVETAEAVKCTTFAFSRSLDTGEMPFALV